MAGVKPTTQIHTHMCYCEFNDIIEAIAALDVDVISFESSRSNMELLRAFTDFRFPAAVGPGVWDVHSRRVPSAEEMARQLQAALRVLPPERLWINPDCGLKTRAWEEVVPPLRNLVAAARVIRASDPGAPFLFNMQNEQTNTQSNPPRKPAPSPGCGGSHSNLASADDGNAQAGLQQGVLDVRVLPPMRRHSLIFETYDGLAQGGSFVLVNDHDPKPLYYQFAYEKPGAFTWNYEEQGPEVWRVRIGKTNVQASINTPAPSAR